MSNDHSPIDADVQAAKDEAFRIIQENLGAEMPDTSDGVWGLLEDAKAAQDQVIAELEAASDRATGREKRRYLIFAKYQAAATDMQFLVHMSCIADRPPGVNRWLGIGDRGVLDTRLSTYERHVGIAQKFSEYVERQPGLMERDLVDAGYAPEEARAFALKESGGELRDDVVRYWALVADRARCIRNELLELRDSVGQWTWSDESCEMIMKNDEMESGPLLGLMKHEEEIEAKIRQLEIKFHEAPSP